MRIHRWTLRAVLLCIFLLSFVVSRPTVFAQDFAWTIENFDVDIEIQEDSTLRVQEAITVQFNEQRHGIYRDMPLEYTNKARLNYNLRVNVLDVVRADGTPWNYDLSSGGGNLRIRIGDAHIWVDGEQTYIITYEVLRGIRYFDDYDELYWNVTGNGWTVPIGSSSATVHYPSAEEGFDAVCFTGYLGSDSQDCELTVTEDSTLARTDSLLPGEGLTVAVSLPKGTVSAPSFVQISLWFLRDNWGFLIPVIALFVLLYIWWSRGRDPKKYHTVVVEFSPPDDLSPAEMGTLHDESADMKDVSAEIIQLAVAKHLTIKEETSKAWVFSNTDYVLKKLENVPGQRPLRPHQKIIMEGLFDTGDSVKVSELRNKFYSYLSQIQEALYTEVVDERKYFPKNPQRIRKFYFIAGSVILFGSFNVIGFLIAFGRIDLMIGTLLLGPVFMIMARIMPRKTLKGAEALRKAHGFRDYIYTAERYRVKFQEDEKIFERFLPYAMIFGIADKWAGSFQGIYKGQPDWYQGDGDFVPTMFVGRLNNFAHAANSSLMSKPGSSGSSSSSSAFGGGSFGGGGFSGGGFGGGGGGSW